MLGGKEDWQRGVEEQSEIDNWVPLANRFSHEAIIDMSG